MHVSISVPAQGIMNKQHSLRPEDWAAGIGSRTCLGRARVIYGRQGNVASAIASQRLARQPPGVAIIQRCRRDVSSHSPCPRSPTTSTAPVHRPTSAFVTPTPTVTVNHPPFTVHTSSTVHRSPSTVSLVVFYSPAFCLVSGLASPIFCLSSVAVPQAGNRPQCLWA